jgi:lipid II:glycine glycyltransferase (peptidoglycan interpeptide bridge formation enzyme)
VAGAQVLLRPIPCSGYSLAYIPRGPVINWADAPLCQTFFTALHTFLHARRVAMLRMEPDVPESICPPSLRPGKPLISPPSDPPAAYFGGLYGAVQGTAIAQRLTRMGFRRTRDRVQLLRTIAIDLTSDEQTIRRRQKPKWRYNTGLAARKGVTIRPAESLEEVQRWYELMEITRKRDRFAGHPFAYYRRAWELLGAAYQAQLLLAEYDGKLLAGAFITLIGKQGIYLYGASGNERRHLMPNHLLQWEAMRWAKAQGATLYDLWGIADSDDPAHPEAGLTCFKRGWGGQVITYIGAFDYVYAPTPYLCFWGGRAIMQQITALRASLRRRGHF